MPGGGGVPVRVERGVGVVRERENVSSAWRGRGTRRGLRGV